MIKMNGHKRVSYEDIARVPQFPREPVFLLIFKVFALAIRNFAIFAYI